MLWSLRDINEAPRRAPRKEKNKTEVLEILRGPTWTPEKLAKVP
jgi:hypothetical protein